ncbi:hypothetical protein K435DRAFT_789505 [Dendrothele bispora CBS 962.96]|uniref:Uncharacterized protein n=1 Tax=Dendrothele bispora (strain CBS 962.96) TaxID=1314807 RepID=A0A4S8MTL9_DENBC|nr:hypothetical protein K435DRAFT_789505 [Dendrothele bispora CBS 962.96]
MNTEFIIVQIPLFGHNLPDIVIGNIITLRKELVIGGDLMEGLNFIMGDIVVVWRAWVLFPERLSARIALSMCLMGSFDITVGTFLYFGLLTKEELENLVGSRSKTEAIALTVPFILTNFTATTLIGIKAWYHFRSIQRNLGSTNGSPSKVLKILLLLIESGLLYIAFWIGDLVLGVTQDGNTVVHQTYLIIMPGLVAIYPILIILVVARENNKPESVNNMSLSQSIRFASVRASKSDDHHSESGGESQLAFSSARIGNGAEVEGNEIEIVPRSG